MTKYAIQAADGGLVAVGIYEEAARDMLRHHPGAVVLFSTVSIEEEFSAVAHFEFRNNYGVSMFSIRTWPRQGVKQRILGYVVTDSDNRPRTMLNAEAVAIKPRGDWAAIVDDYFDLEVERDG